jgi:two-component system, chemotaxis family, sensor kinase CheA
LKDIRQKLLATFQIEHRDHVEQIRGFLGTIAGEPAEPASTELEEAFRRAHSLKGAARAVDLNAVEGLAHRLETLFSRVRQGVLLLDRSAAAVAQQVLDASEDCVAALGENRGLSRDPAPGYQSSLRAIEQLLGMKAEASAAPTASGPEAVSVPAFETLETVRIAARNFDGLLRSAGGLLTESLRQNQVAERLNGITKQLAAMEKETESVHRVTAESLRRSFAGREPSRVGAGRDLSRVSSFLQSMEKQVRSLSKQAVEVRRLQQRSNWTMRHLGRQLEQDVRQARLLPVEGLLEGYRKLVRDLARDESREVEFRASSTGVHADRRVLEALKDPLMHLLRNTISHGIETPRERLAKAKPAMGLVTLRIEAEGQRLTIVVEDDGRGVDFARVAEVAVRQRILSEAEAAQRSPQELSRILFQPGFSTSRSVTSLAGRGMGLSVVYEAVRRLQGEVDLGLADGCGTRFRISVPLSISTHRLMLIRSGSRSFAVPINAIERLHRVKPGSVEILEGKPMILLDRQPVPLFSMKHLVSAENTAAPPTAAAGRTGVLQVMILRAGGKRAAVAVDAFLRETDAVILDLGPAAAQDGKISGGIILEDGSVAFVLSVAELLGASVHRELDTLLHTREPGREKASFSILVVDDSLTTRTLEKSILEAHGYRVQVAVDGLDALEKLRAEKADLVISDIQMPRLDGFGLLQALKKDPGLDRIPVIMVTSVDRPEDQERGLSLGAGAWIVKRKFDQAELLSAIGQVLCK